MRETEQIKERWCQERTSFCLAAPFTQFFNRFTNFNASSLSIYHSISSIFPVFCHGVTRFLHHYPYVTSVCLTRTQMHFPQSLPVHRINGFVRFFHGFISVFLLHSGHTSEPQFFLCFSIVSRALHEKGPTSEPQFFHCFSIPSISIIYFYFTWHHFRPTSEPQFFQCFSIVLLHFFIIVPQFFHCFSIANGLTSKPPFFHCFSIVLLDIIFPSIPVSAVFFHSFSSNFTQSSRSLRYQFILPFRQFFQRFAMVLLDFSIITIMLPQCV